MPPRPGVRARNLEIAPCTPFLASHCVSRSVRGPFTLCPQHPIERPPTAVTRTAVCTETTARAHAGTKALRRKNKIPTMVWATSDHSMTSSQEYATPLPTSGPRLMVLLSQLPFYVVNHPSELSWRKHSLAPQTRRGPPLPVTAPMLLPTPLKNNLGISY